MDFHKKKFVLALVLITKGRQLLHFIIKSTESNLLANYDIPLLYGTQIRYLLEEAHRWLLVMTLFNFLPHNISKLPSLSSSLRV